VGLCKITYILYNEHTAHMMEKLRDWEVSLGKIL
jgi:hypothetical protein